MEAIRQAPRLAVAEVGDRAGFMALERRWDALCEAQGDVLFQRHGWIRIWLDNFAPTARLRILTAVDENGELSAVLPLMEERTFWYGVPLRQLVSTANPHACRFDLLARDATAAGEAFFTYLIQDPTWDVLRLIDIPEGGAGWAVYHQAKTRGFPCGTWESLRSPYLTLPATHEALIARLDARFKANVRRRRRKLEAQGKVTVERVDGAAALEAKLEEGYALEQSGWKGARGTAITQNQATRGFYSELARDAAHAGRLSLYFLRLNGRAVAFQYGLTHAGRYLLLKPGYDETLKECSPGQLLMDEVLKDCLARGLREFDFLGPDMVWKRDWTDQTRVHTWLFMFRNSSKGRALCTARFHWLPKAKEALSRWKR